MINQRERTRFSPASDREMVVAPLVKPVIAVETLEATRVARVASVGRVVVE